MVLHGPEFDNDPFRDSLLRYLGYTNEVGEAFAPFIPRWAYFGSYALSCAYALGDAAHKGIHYHEHASQDHVPYSQNVAAVGAVVDTALWQGLASGQSEPFQSSSVTHQTE
eukprot:m.34450 g.34450  ORF g.34450 m.34450 type:complete len:111 (-) comp12306_c0_seq2:450-782(-)